MLKFKKEKKSRDTDNPQGISSRGLITIGDTLKRIKQQFRAQLAKVAPDLEPGF